MKKAKDRKPSMISLLLLRSSTKIQTSAWMARRLFSVELVGPRPYRSPRQKIARRCLEHGPAQESLQLAYRGSHSLTGQKPRRQVYRCDARLVNTLFHPSFIIRSGIHVDRIPWTRCIYSSLYHRKICLEHTCNNQFIFDIESWPEPNDGNVLGKGPPWICNFPIGQTFIDRQSELIGALIPILF